MRSSIFSVGSLSTCRTSLGLGVVSSGCLTAPCTIVPPSVVDDDSSAGGGGGVGGDVVDVVLVVLAEEEVLSTRWSCISRPIVAGLVELCSRDCCSSTESGEVIRLGGAGCWFMSISSPTAVVVVVEPSSLLFPELIVIYDWPPSLLGLSLLIARVLFALDLTT